MSRKNLPLDGVTVIDLGQVYQGPYCTLLMAKAGANVIKVEPLIGEPIRHRVHVSQGAAIPFAMPSAMPFTTPFAIHSFAAIDSISSSHSGLTC